MNKRIAIIGAGASGLPSIRHALLYNLEVVCFEGSDAVGGLWRIIGYEEHCYQHFQRNDGIFRFSKEMTAYSDFPPLPEMANFMHNREMLRYLQLYAENFDLLKYIKFNTKVKCVERAEDYGKTGKWKITYLTPEGETKTEIFDSVLMCSGHHTIPHFPKPWEGQDKFKGKIIHSHSYKDHKGYEDKVVVVVGVGNSGGDVAVELSRIARQVYLVTRRGTWVFNRVYDYGLPYDFVLNRKINFRLKNSVPSFLSNGVAEWKLNKRFDHARYGLKPAHRVFGAHPTVNDELPTRIASGTIRIKPNIRKFTETGIEFENGSFVDNVDTVVLSTGYSFEFDLIEDGKLIPVCENEVDLFMYMYPIDLADHNTLSIVGLVQPFGSIMPVSEMQARVFLENLYGTPRLPSRAEMQKSIKDKRDAMSCRYVKSRRHTIQVDYCDYMDELADIIGAKPNFLEILKTDPCLAFKIEFGPGVPYMYRLKGPHPWDGAKKALETVNERVDKATNMISNQSCRFCPYTIGAVLLSPSVNKFVINKSDYLIVWTHSRLFK